MLTLPAQTNTWSLPPPGNHLVSQNAIHVVEDNDGSLGAIAEEYSVGFLALLQANLGTDPYVPHPGSVSTTPLQTLLPDAPREGIVISFVELRLHCYQPRVNSVTVYPIGIGQLGGSTLTSTMVTTISDKRTSPTWAPTANVRARYRTNGIDLPVVVPTDPDSPMGRHATRLTAYGGVHLLHGTNADFGIGIRISSNYVCLCDDDTETLLRRVAPGTKVSIINTPIRTFVESSDVYLVEIHRPLSEKINGDPQLLSIMLNASMQTFKNVTQTDAVIMDRAIKIHSGMSVDITRHHGVTQQPL